ncbi:MAG TPA: cyanophycin synthetase, partial [Isosphaeraceae bacterium]|nr:cyanophycin synthetase [Isosphaeraceae bacterium]
VLETARGGILRAGLGFDRADVAVVTNIGEGDHLGISDIHTLEDLARVKRVIAENVGPNGSAVLNAADPLVANMAPFCPGSVIFFAQDPENAVIQAHRALGGRAVVIRHGEIVLVEGTRETGLARLFDIPLTHGGRIGFQVENTLASAAAAWALGIDTETIRNGLESFGSEMHTVPGRFNLLEIGGATVVLDYGHNPSALLAMIEAIDPLPHERRMAVYSAAGDRRDEDMIRQGQILAGAFDSVYLYEDQYTRGRADGEIMALFRQGLNAGGRVRSVQEFRGSIKAVEAALKAVRSGDLLLLQADVVDETLDFVKAYLASGVPGREIDLNEAMDVPAHDVIFAGPLLD